MINLVLQCVDQTCLQQDTGVWLKENRTDVIHISPGTAYEEADQGVHIVAAFSCNDDAQKHEKIASAN